MQDGSFASLEKTISRIGKLVTLLEIDVQFRDVGFWGLSSL
jgi:hypothetical protein